MSDLDKAASTATKSDDAKELKVPTDLSRVSNAKARELIEAGVVEDGDLPAKMYKRKVDGFVARIPNYTFDAYGPDLQAEWDEIKLTTDVDPPTDAPA